MSDVSEIADLAERIRERDERERSLSKRLREADEVIAPLINQLPTTQPFLLADQAVGPWRVIRDENPDLYLTYCSFIRSKCGANVEQIVLRHIGVPPLEPTLYATWRPVDLAALATTEPAPPSSIIADWLPCGEVTLLAGHGGAGKSAIALYLGTCIALGATPWPGMKTERRRVAFLSAEDGQNVLHWRLRRICDHLGVKVADLVGWLQLIDASHADSELLVETREGTRLTPAYEALREAIGNAGVLIVDGASDTFGASEIVRRSVRAYIRALRRLIPADGAVLVLSHIDKTAARGAATSDRYSGSTAWNNSVRARWSLAPDGDDGSLILKLEKANHAPAGAEVRLRWDAAAHMHVAETPSGTGIVGAIQDRLDRDAIVAAIRACPEPIPAAMTGPRTAWHVLAARPELPARYRKSREGRGDFWRAIEQLRAMSILREDTIRRSDRHYTRVLRLVSEDCGPCGQ